MRTLILCAAFIAGLAGAASSTEPEDSTYKLSCSEALQSQEIIDLTDGLITHMCANTLETEAHVRIYVCDGSSVAGLVGPADALAEIPSPCDLKSAATAPIGEWTCKDGRAFTAQIHVDLSALIKADGETYLLLHAPNSLNGHYERRGVVLQVGPGSAELTGATGGPYEGCVA